MSGLSSTDIRQLRLMNKNISNIVTRAVVQTIRQDGGKIFVQVTGLSNQVRDGVEMLQQYGFRSFPNPGSRGIALSKGGKIYNSSVVCTDDKRFGKTPEYEAGESRQYDEQGAFHRIFDDMHFSEGDSYEWKTPNGDKAELMDGEFKITIGSTTFEFTSSGLLVTGGGVKANLIDLETHLTTGVTPGAGVSDVPV